MGILSWIVIGLLAGLAARFVTKSRMGIIVTIIVGIIGAIAGGWVMTAVTDTAPGSRDSRCGVSWWRSPGPWCCSSSTVSSKAEAVPEAPRSGGPACCAALSSGADRAPTA